MSTKTLFDLVRQAHEDHLRRAIRLKDGSVLTGVVTAVVGGAPSDDARVKVVVEAPPRERRWLRLSDIECID